MLNRLVLAGAFAVSGPALLVAVSGDPKSTTAENYKVDPMHSSMVFRIKHFNVAYFYGRFNKLSGSVTFDADQPENSSLEVSATTADVDTNSKERDRHIKGPEFFDAKQYPKITFKSTSFKKKSASVYEVAGQITLHGTTRPLTVKLEHTGSGPDPWGGYRRGFETTFTIKRSDFGMDRMLSALGDEIRITVSLECVRQ